MQTLCSAFCTSSSTTSLPISSVMICVLGRILIEPAIEIWSPVLCVMLLALHPAAHHELCLVETIKINWSLCFCSGTAEQLSYSRARSQISGLAGCQGGGVTVRETALQSSEICLLKWPTLCSSVDTDICVVWRTASKNRNSKLNIYEHNNGFAVWFEMWICVADVLQRTTICFIWLWW